MAALGSQQWYIEEIPAKEKDEESGDAACGREKDSEGGDSAPRAFISLDMDAAVRLDTPQSKEGNTPNTSSEATARGDEDGKRPVAGAWTCKTIAASSSAQSPYPRGGCSWTKVGSRFLLFGGADAFQQHFADTHSFDAKSGKWEKITARGTPPSPRNGHSAVALGESLVVYGGMNGQDGVTFNDMYELRPGPEGCMEWVSLPCANIPPRNSHVSVLDGETMVIIGGASPEGQTNDVFTIDLSTRSNLTCDRVSCQSFEQGPDEGFHSDGVGEIPSSREMHSACVFDSEGTEGARATTVLLMGGRSATGVLRDLFSLDTGSWTWKRLKDAPVTRCAHSSCFMETARVMAIYGGWDGGQTVAGDLHLFDLRCGEWTTPSISPRPVGRFAHAACAVMGRERLLVFGGVNPGEDLDDVVELTRACP